MSKASSVKNKQLWGTVFVGCGMTSLVALIATTGMLPVWVVIVLVVLTACFFSGVVSLFGLARTKTFKIGHPIKASVIHGGIWITSAFIGWLVLPPPPIPHIHITAINFSVPDAAMGHAGARVVFANDGKAATKLTSAGKMAWYIDQGDMQKRWAFEDTLFNDEPGIESTQKIAFDLPAGSDRSITLKSSKWEQGAVQSFLNGTGSVYATGVLFYTNAQNGVCRTRYCMYMDRDGTGKFCARHNEEPQCL